MNHQEPPHRLPPSPASAEWPSEGFAEREAFLRSLRERTVDFNSTREVVIDRAYKWDPDMSKCPRGTKVQLLGAGGVPSYALYDGKDPFWVKWAPLPSN